MVTESLGQYSIGLELSLDNLAAGLEHATAIMNQQTKEMTGLMNLFAEKFDQSILMTKNSLKMSEAAFKEYGTEAGNSVKKASSDIEESSTKINSSFDKIKKGIAFGLAGLIGINLGTQLQKTLTSVYDFDDKVRKLSITLGTNAEESSKLAAITQKYGTSADSLTRGLTILTKNAESNTTAFKAYGIQAKDNNGDLLNANTLLENVAQKYQELGGGLAGAAMAQSVMGRGAKDLLPVLALGKDGIKAVEDEASKMGLVLTTDSLKAFNEYRISTMEVKEAMAGLTVQIGNIFLPILASLGAAITHTIEWWNSLDGGLRTIIVTVGSVALAVKLLSSTLVTDLCAAVYSTVTAFAIANAEWLIPVAVFAAVAAAAVALYQNFETVMKSIARVAKDAATIVWGAWEMITNPSAPGTKSAVENISKSFDDLGNAGVSAFNNIGDAAKAAWNNTKAFFTPNFIDVKENTNPQEFTNTAHAPKGKKGEDAYHKAKDSYNSDIDAQALKGVELTAEQKEAIYKKYLANVKKTSQENTDYLNGLAKLETEAKKEQLEIQKIKYEELITTNKISQEQIYQDKLKEADQEISLHTKGTVAYEQAVLKRMKIDVDYQNWKNDQETKALNFEEKHQERLLAIDEENINHRKNLGLMSDADEIQAKTNLEARKYQLQVSTLQKEQALYSKDTEKYKEYNQQILTAEEEHNIKMLQLNNQLDEKKKQSLTQFGDETKTSFQNSISSMLQGTATLSQGLKGLYTSILKSFSDMIAKMVVDWVTQHVVMNIATHLFGATKVATNAAVEGSNTLLDGSNTLVAISNEAVGTTALQAGVETATGAAATATAGGLLAGFAAAVSAITIPIAALATTMAGLALSAVTLAISMPIIALSTALMGASSVLAAAGTALLAGAMVVLAPLSIAFVPFAALMAAEFAVIGAAALIAANAAKALAVALAATSVAGIPIVGAALAPAAAAATGAAITAASLPSYDVGAWNIPCDMPAMVHKNETILPKPFAEDFRNVMSGNSNSNNGNSNSDTPNITVSYNLSAVDKRGMDSLLKEHSKTLGTIVTKYQKKESRYGRL